MMRSMMKKGRGVTVVVHGGRNHAVNGGSGRGRKRLSRGKTRKWSGGEREEEGNNGRIQWGEGKMGVGRRERQHDAGERD